MLKYNLLRPTLLLPQSSEDPKPPRVNFILPQTSEDWWMCTDGEEVGYIPPSCLLETNQSLDIQDIGIPEEIDLKSILKSVEEEDDR